MARVFRIAGTVTVTALLSLTFNPGVASADSADDAFLQNLRSLGAQVPEEREDTAIAVGKYFCDQMDSGATQPQAHWATEAEFPEVSRQNIYKAAASAVYIYCQEYL